MALRLAEAQTVTVEAFDLVGRRVAVLHDGPAAAGTLALTLDARSLPAGVYLVRATSPTSTAALRVATVR